jgi:hypothetical protein
MDTEQLALLAGQAGMGVNEYLAMILESWTIDHTYECPECLVRIPNGMACSCKASERL